MPSPRALQTMQARRWPLLLCRVFVVLIAALGAALAQAQDPGAESESEQDLAAALAQSSELRLRAQLLQQQESREGAYGASLGEQLLGMGITLQREGQHDEAIKVLRRGGHLARINDGLYSGEQIPFLRAEISSHIKIGDYALADERQTYLHRVQRRSLNSGKALAAAYMQQADWHDTALNLAPSDADGARLLQMRQLYRLAISEVLKVEGDQSPALLPPLYGLLRTHHKITRYELNALPANPATFNELEAREEQTAMVIAQSQSFREGLAVVEAIRDIEVINAQGEALPGIEARVLKGDWLLWNEKRERAFDTYREALTELAALDDAQLEVDRLFAQPMALPQLERARVLPRPVDPAEGNILLEFRVSERGRASDVEVLANDEIPTRTVSRLKRRVRMTPFRPRFEGFEPVVAEKVQKAYVLDNAQP